jgi:hypothetical protein
MSNQFQNPEEVFVEEITIGGEDVMGLFLKLDIFENIFTPIITGQIQLMETDGSAFLEKYEIEGNESITFSARGPDDAQLQFEGVLNGLRNRMENGNKKIYLFDFTTMEMRNNEQTRITKAFKDIKPEEVVSEMVESMGGTMDKEVGQGLPLTYNAPRQRPWDVIKYILTHGVTSNSSAEDGEEVRQQEHKAQGTTGFLLWQCLSGYRFCSIDDLLRGQGGDNRGEFSTQLANRSHSLDKAHKTILKYDFPISGDIQAKMRSGGFNSVNIIFDIDKGLYKEYSYDASEESNLMTEKQKEAVKAPTRYTSRIFSNESFHQDCNKAQSNVGDQSKLNTAQTYARENTFDDLQGTFSLYPQFNFRAGDTMTAKISKVIGTSEGGYDKKYSGRYIIKEVSHSFRVDAKGYTKIGVIRSTIQTDDASSTKA